MKNNLSWLDGLKKYFDKEEGVVYKENYTRKEVRDIWYKSGQKSRKYREFYKKKAQAANDQTAVYKQHAELIEKSASSLAAKHLERIAELEGELNRFSQHSPGTRYFGKSYKNSRYNRNVIPGSLIKIQDITEMCTVKEVIDRFQGEEANISYVRKQGPINVRFYVRMTFHNEQGGRAYHDCN